MAPKPLTDVSVAAELVKGLGNLSTIAAAHGVTRQAVSQFIKDNEELKLLKDEMLERRLDIGEDALLHAVQREEGWAVRFLLNSLARARGYTERFALTGGDGGPLQVQIIDDIPENPSK